MATDPQNIVATEQGKWVEIVGVCCIVRKAISHLVCDFVLIANNMVACCALQVAMAMAAKAKLLLRELKTVKADLAFAKERCIQLEEENKMLRESHGRVDGLEDDDLV